MNYYIYILNNSYNKNLLFFVKIKNTSDWKYFYLYTGCYHWNENGFNHDF